MTQLDDRQLRDKLAKAGSDMPHVDLWPQLRQEAAAISEVAQRRRRGAGFSPFTATRLLAPAFALLLVISASLASLQGHQQRLVDSTPTSAATHVDAINGGVAGRSAALDRRMAVADERVQQATAGQYTTSTDQATSGAAMSDLDADRLAARELRREVSLRVPPVIRLRPGPQTD